ncbi:MAG TPA: DUF362 domain-containing protein [Desulfocapsa sulfexigens]|nr:DUF362 domain-containing protein [Desulfocapsa sulfexigens]
MQDQLDMLKIPEDLSNRRILLKPNLISASAPPLACSNPFFVKAAASSFLSRGARVLIGDSPAFGKAATVLRRQGFTRAFSGMAVEPVTFKTRVLKTLDCGITVGVATEALDCDYFINLPRIKAHDQMGITMAVKNVFGIVLGARKAWLHMRHGESWQDFSRMILDLHQLLPPSLVLADGIEVMNRRGPMRGPSLALGCLAASRNAVALDRAMLEVLEIKNERVPLVQTAWERNLTGASLRDIDFPQLLPQAFHGSGFQVPATLIPVRFKVVRYLRSSIKRMFSP